MENERNNKAKKLALMILAPLFCSAPRSGHDRLLSL